MNTIVMAPTVLPDASPLEYIRAAVDSGFKSIGLRLHRSPVMPFYPVVGDSILTREIKYILEGEGVNVLEVTSFYVLPEMDFPEYVAAMELGAELGARIALVICDDHDRSRMQESFGRLCEAASALGLTCAVENAPNRALETVADIVRVIADTGVRNAALCLDPVNHICSGGTAGDLAALDRKLFPYTQLADAQVAPGCWPIVDGRKWHIPRRLYGDGNMNLDEILDALPNGLPISIELPLKISASLPHANGMPLPPAQWARYALEATQNYLEGYEQRKAQRGKQ